MSVLEGMVVVKGGQVWAYLGGKLIGMDARGGVDGTLGPTRGGGLFFGTCHLPPRLLELLASEGKLINGTLQRCIRRLSRSGAPRSALAHLVGSRKVRLLRSSYEWCSGSR